jgi:hypothetical protein
LKILSKVIIGAALLLGSVVCSMADTMWTLDDVFFTNGNEATGWFITDPTSTHIESFSIQVTGSDSADAFTAAIMPDTYLANTPPEIGIANSDWSEYVDLYLASSLTSAGGTIDLTGGYDCPGCGVLRDDSDFRPRVIGSAVSPEPSTIPALGAAVILMGMIARRKLVRAS